MKNANSPKLIIKLIWVPAVVSILNVIFLFLVSHQGFDHTDEGYAMNLIANPHTYAGSIASRFGHLLQFPYKLLGSNLLWLRRFNLLLIVFVSLFTSIYAVHKSFPVNCNKKNPLRVRAFSYLMVGLPISSTALLGLWPAITPTYNTLNFYGVIFSSLASVLLFYNSYQTSWPERLLGFFSLTLALSFLIFAKATTYIIVCLMVLLIGLFLKRSMPLIIACIFCSFAFYSADYYYQFKSLDLLLGDIQFGLDAQSVYLTGGELGYSLSSLLARIFPGRSNLLALFMAAFSALLLLKAGKRSLIKASFWLQRLAFFALGICFLGLIKSMQNNYFFGIHILYLYQNIILPFWLYLMLIMLLVCLCGLLAPYGADSGFVRKFFTRFLPGYFRSSNVSPTVHTIPAHFSNNSDVLVPLFLGFMPFAFAFGTGNSFYLIASISIFPLFLAFVIALPKHLKKEICSFFSLRNAMAVFAVSFASLVSSLNLLVSFVLTSYPASLPSFNRDGEKRYPLQGVPLQGLAESESKANFINKFISLAQEAGFQSGDEIIDLSGNYPGLVFSIGGVPLGSGWFLSMLPASHLAAIKLLGGIPREKIDNAWILLSSQNSKTLSRALSNLELNHHDPCRFELVAALPVPHTDDKDKIFLFKPIPVKARTHQYGCIK